MIFKEILINKTLDFYDIFRKSSKVTFYNIFRKSLKVLDRNISSSLWKNEDPLS